jgi:hypothetical protein
MGSVMTVRECPQCGAAASADYYHRTGEECVQCEWCGYYCELRWQDDVLVPEETMGYAAVEYGSRNKGCIQASIVSADDLAKCVESAAGCEYAFYRRYLGDGRWIEVNALTGEEKPVTVPRMADLTHADPEDGRTNQIYNSYIPGTSAPATPLPDNGPPVDWPSKGL